MRDDKATPGYRVEVTRDPDAGRWEARVDGELAGVLVHRVDEAGRTVLEHTEVREAFEGRGIGSRLARTALDEIRAEGGRVVVECPFVRAWLRRHREYDDIIDRR
ncbi:MAG TPA: GNAT family N-acetyltransferase [Candidatus Limnocylindrales bacterium]